MTEELTDSERQTVKEALRALVAIERDRQLGYRESELHMDPTRALRKADDALEALGDDPEEVIWADDREKLGLQR